MRQRVGRIWDELDVSIVYSLVRVSGSLMIFLKDGNWVITLMTSLILVLTYAIGGIIASLLWGAKILGVLDWLPPEDASDNVSFALARFSGIELGIILLIGLLKLFHV